VLIVVVVLAGLPLAIVRRRQRSTPADEEEKGAEGRWPPST